MADLSLRNVKKIYDNTVVAVQSFNLEIADKEFIVLVGPSGCGKSTTLRMVAGLEEISEGEIYIAGRKVNTVPPKDRDIAMVFQNYALYPHMTVYDNIAYGLKLRKFPKRVIDQKVREAAEILDITELLKRKPKALSGGQRQALTLLMATMVTPKLLLLDEPAAGMNPQETLELASFIHDIRDKYQLTIFLIEHHMDLVMNISDRIYVLDFGSLIAEGTPEEIQGNQRVIDAYLGVADDE